RPHTSMLLPYTTLFRSMELGMIQPGSIIPDIPGKSKVNNYGGTFYGLVTAREALTYSYNVSADIIYRKILGENPAEKYLSKMNIDRKSTRLNSSHVSIS